MLPTIFCIFLILSLSSHCVVSGWRGAWASDPYFCCSGEFGQCCGRGQQHVYISAVGALYIQALKFQTFAWCNPIWDLYCSINPPTNLWWVCISPLCTQLNGLQVPHPHISPQNCQLRGWMWWGAIHASTDPACWCTQVAHAVQAVCKEVCWQECLLAVGSKPCVPSSGIRSHWGHVCQGCIVSLSMWKKNDNDIFMYSK